MANENSQDTSHTEVTDQIADEEQSTAADEVTVEGLQAQLASLAAAFESAKEQSLRSQAEAQNARRRAEQDVEKAHKFGLEKIINDLLPVVDNLERALASTSTVGEDLGPFVEGIQLTLKSFIDALARHQVLVVDPQGEPFDPQFHEAVSAVPNPEVEPNTVINVFQKGYTLNGRLIRPAMVVVAKGA